MTNIDRAAEMIYRELSGKPGVAEALGVTSELSPSDAAKLVALIENTTTSSADQLNVTVDKPITD